jgi:DNA polymerase III epsilon subunit-like protein
MIMYRYIFGDTETTGLGKDAGIVEISWIETDEHFNEVERHYSLINPGKPIQAGAMGAHGITEAMVADSPTILRVHGRLLPALSKGGDQERVSWPTTAL